MDYVIGVDIGTQSTKALLCDTAGRIAAQMSNLPNHVDTVRHVDERQQTECERADEQPERGIPEPAKAEEHDTGRSLVDEHEAAAHCAQAVLDDDIHDRVLGT